MLGITLRDEKIIEWIREKTKVRNIIESVCKQKFKDPKTNRVSLTLKTKN